MRTKHVLYFQVTAAKIGRPSNARGWNRESRMHMTVRVNEIELFEIDEFENEALKNFGGEKVQKYLYCRELPISFNCN